MPDPRIANLAKVIVDYSVGIKPGDQVFLTATPAATPLIQEMYKLIMQRGGHLTPIISLPGMNPIFYEYANDDQLSYVPPVLKQVIETFDVRIAISSETNTRELRQRRSGQTGAARPGTALAHADLHGSQRQRCAALERDPVPHRRARPGRRHVAGGVRGLRLRRMPVRPARPRRRLAGGGTPDSRSWSIGWPASSEVHLVGPDTDLTIGIAGRTFVNCCGDKNMPDGEVFTGPEETKVNGHVCFTFPAIYQGREVSGVRLWFEDGVVVKSSAAKNEEFLTQMLNTDEGARRLGEFAFGTNFGIQRFIKSILFDEKIGGTVHMALGGGYPETGSTNRSAIHWDMICDLRHGGEVTVDGELFAKDGKYVLWE